MTPHDRHADEVASGERFEFGKNWTRFWPWSTTSGSRRPTSLSEMLGRERLDGIRFLDIGSGAACSASPRRRLGAEVHSFDYDPHSVACTREMKTRYRPDDSGWCVERGSALDPAFMTRLGRFDIVYSWGVLHHTGAMWEALDQAQRAVGEDGGLFIAIYNDTGSQSARWKQIKHIYTRLPRPCSRRSPLAVSAPEEAKSLLRSLVTGRPQDYVRSWTSYDQRRGMSHWHDIIDWVGGLSGPVRKAGCHFHVLSRAWFCSGEAEDRRWIGVQ